MLINSSKRKIDYYLFIPSILLGLFSLLTLSSFGEIETRFIKQSVWMIFGIITFIAIHYVDLSFIKNRKFTLTLYVACIIVLALLFITGHISKGAQSWIKLGMLSIQPTDPAKLALIIILAKYFSKRHMEIGAFKHVFVSGIYAFILFILILFQPDFGSSLTILAIWGGIVFVSGISKKHLLVLFSISLIVMGLAWSFLFKEYQKDRILNFVQPMRDIRGSGYNQYQAVIAVGSGELLGKGVGYGTQSRLKFLPEYQTDFIYAAHAEEWGFVGSVLVILLYLFILLRLIYLSSISNNNFDTLFIVGTMSFLAVHIIVNVGMNIGAMPVTGIPLPFMSYGGSHLIIEFITLGIVSNIIGQKKIFKAKSSDDFFEKYL